MFTREELLLIIKMICIADAGERSAGDYADWSEDDYLTMERLSAKTAASLLNKPH